MSDGVSELSRDASCCCWFSVDIDTLIDSSLMLIFVAVVVADVVAV